MTGQPNNLATRTSLLLRLRDPTDAAAWREFETQYRELMIRFCKRRGLQHADAEDVVQRALAGLAKSLPRFTYEPQRGRFRDYLFRSVRNALCDWTRAKDGSFDPLRTTLLGILSVDPDADELAHWEQEWVSHHYRLAMEVIRGSFEPKSIEIFDRSVTGATVGELAREFNLTEDAIRKTRQRIRSRMEELIAFQVREEDTVEG